MKNIIRGSIASFWRDFVEPQVDGETVQEHWAGGYYSCLRTGGKLHATYLAY